MYLVETASPTGNWFAEAVGSEKECRQEVIRLTTEIAKNYVNGSSKWGKGNECCVYLDETTLIFRAHYEEIRELGKHA